MSLISNKEYFQISFRTNETWFLFVNKKFDKIYGEEREDYMKDLIHFTDCHIFHGKLSGLLHKGMSWGGVADELSTYNDRNESIDKVIEILREAQDSHQRYINNNFTPCEVKRSIAALNNSLYGGFELDSWEFRKKLLPVLVEYLKNHKVFEEL